MVLLNPIFERLDEELAHHGLLRGGLVTAARAVSKRAVGVEAVVVARHGQLETAPLDTRRVVIDHVEHHAQTRLVHRLHQSLQLADAGCGVSRIGRVGTLGGIEVLRLVAPVVLRIVLHRLVNRTEVGRRQEVNMAYTQLHQVIQSRRQTVGALRTVLGHTEVLTRVAHTGRGVGRHVAVVHLIDRNLGCRVKRRTLILTPPLGVGPLQIEHHTTLTVRRNGTSKDTRRFAKPLAADLHAEGVLLPLLIALLTQCPEAGFGGLHRKHLLQFAGRVKSHLNLLGRRCPKGKAGHFGRVVHLRDGGFGYGPIAIRATRRAGRHAQSEERKGSRFEKFVHLRYHFISYSQPGF